MRHRRENGHRGPDSVGPPPVGEHVTDIALAGSPLGQPVMAAPCCGGFVRSASSGRALPSNPVAVVLDAESLTTEEMRRFTRWTNLSEATLCCRRTIRLPTIASAFSPPPPRRLPVVAWPPSFLSLATDARNMPCQGLGKVPECRVHGLVMAVRPGVGVVSRAMRRRRRRCCERAGCARPHGRRPVGLGSGRRVVVTPAGSALPPLTRPGALLAGDPLPLLGAHQQPVLDDLAEAEVHRRSQVRVGVAHHHQAQAPTRASTSTVSRAPRTRRARTIRRAGRGR